MDFFALVLSEDWVVEKEATVDGDSGGIQDLEIWLLEIGISNRKGRLETRTTEVM